MAIRILIGATIVTLIVAGACSSKGGVAARGVPDEAAAAEMQAITIDLTRTLHFATADGKSAKLGPGVHIVEDGPDGALILTSGHHPQGILLAADAFAHEQALETHTAMALEPEEGHEQVVLLMPDGTGRVAVGSASPVVRTRGGWTAKRVARLRKRLRPRVKRLASVSLSVSKPTAKDTWTPGKVYRILWSRKEEMPGTVRIGLYQGLKKVRDISKSTANSGRYEWKIPGSTRSGSYSVRVTTTDGVVGGKSADFRILRREDVNPLTGRQRKRKGGPSTWFKTVKNVEDAFKRIETHGQQFACRKGSGFPTVGYRKRDSSVTAEPAITGSHFQGIQRIHGHYLAITGNGTNASHLFIVKIGSRPQHSGGRLRTNLLGSMSPPSSDRIVKPIWLSREYKHAGGCQMVDKVLAIPLENGGSSQIVFYDVKNPEAPQPLPHTVDCGSSQAGAVGITKLANGTYLMVVARKNAHKLDFYRSAKTSLHIDPVFQPLNSNPWQKADLVGGDGNWGAYQNINLFRQDDGQLYMIGLHNTGANTDNLSWGRDWADLFKVELGEDNPTITKIDKRHMWCQYGPNFNAGAGAYVDPSGRLMLYAVEYWPGGSKIRMNEFRSHSDEVRFVDGSWVELYDDEHYKDRSVMIDWNERAAWDYGNYDQLPGGFEDKTSSVRWQIAPGWYFLLFEDKSYKGRLKILEGTGKIEGFSSFKDPAYFTWDWNDKVSSSGFRKKVIHDIGEAWIELYDDKNFKDRRLRIFGGSGAASYLSNYKKFWVEGKKGFNDKVSSVRYQIPDGYTYRLYDDAGCSDTYFNLVGNGRIKWHNDLGKYGFNDKTSSSRYLD